MLTIILIKTFVIFLSLIKYIIFAEIILSWLSVFGINLNINFIREITTPLYNFIKKYIPTHIGMIDFAPLIIIIAITFILGSVEYNTGINMNNIFN